jgi:hypothetical protein
MTLGPMLFDRLIIVHFLQNIRLLWTGNQTTQNKKKETIILIVIMNSISLSSLNFSR